MTIEKRTMVAVKVRMEPWVRRLLRRAASEAGTSMAKLMRQGGRQLAESIIEEGPKEEVHEVE